MPPEQTKLKALAEGWRQKANRITVKWREAAPETVKIVAATLETCAEELEETLNET